MGKYDKYKGRYKTKYADRIDYFSKYKRKITPERKEYLKQYNKNISTEKYREYHNTENFKIAKRIITLIHRALSYKSETKSIKSTELLGWSKEDFFERIGSPSNKQVDHKIPVSWFIKETSVKIINNLENLQLLEATENVQKSNRFCHPVSKSYFDQVLPFIKEQYLPKLIAC